MSAIEPTTFIRNRPQSLRPYCPFNVLIWSGYGTQATLGSPEGLRPSQPL